MHRNKLSSFKVGEKIPYGPLTISKEDIIAFAEKYDPVFFHTDEEAAQDSMLEGLAASGIHTCALTMRMMCDAYLIGSTSQGAPEAQEINWLGPVRPGDTLHGLTTVLNVRVSNSRPNMQIVDFMHETFNQNNQPVLSMKNTGFFAKSSAKA